MLDFARTWLPFISLYGVGGFAFLIGIILILIGLRQDKKKPFDDLDKIPLTKPTTKILFGSFFCVFGLIR